MPSPLEQGQTVHRSEAIDKAGKRRTDQNTAIQKKYIDYQIKKYTERKRIDMKKKESLNHDINDN